MSDHSFRDRCREEGCTCFYRVAPGYDIYHPSGWSNMSKFGQCFCPCPCTHLTEEQRTILLDRFNQLSDAQKIGRESMKLIMQQR